VTGFCVRFLRWTGRVDDVDLAPLVPFDLPGLVVVALDLHLVEEVEEVVVEDVVVVVVDEDEDEVEDEEDEDEDLLGVAVDVVVRFDVEGFESLEVSPSEAEHFSRDSSTDEIESVIKVDDEAKGFSSMATSMLSASSSISLVFPLRLPPTPSRKSPMRELMASSSLEIVIGEDSGSSIMMSWESSS